MKKGVILNNIGSPKAPDIKSVKAYLREFLMDPGVIELPFIFRFILVYFVISIFRAPKSALKYQKIWTPLGSPLIAITKSLARKLQNYSPQLAVEVGMQFQTPSVRQALDSLLKENSDLEKIYLVPMFPQYSIATTAASIEKFKKELERVKEQYKKNEKPVLQAFVIKPFFDADFFIDPIVEKIKDFDLTQYDCLLFSYHGLPVSAILKNPQCRLNDECCPSGMKSNCYRSQCYATTRAILKKLDTKIDFKTTFQSRLGRGEWIKPYTDEVLLGLAAQPDKRRILVVCPAFTIDCLETLEEIQIENKQLFLSAGGQIFDYVPCLNDDETWGRGLSFAIQNDSFFDRL